MTGKDLKRVLQKISAGLIILAITVTMIAANVVTAEENRVETEDYAAENEEAVTEEDIPEEPISEEMETNETVSEGEDPESEDPDSEEQEIVYTDIIDQEIAVSSETEPEDPETTETEPGLSVPGETEPESFSDSIDEYVNDIEDQEENEQEDSTEYSGEMAEGQPETETVQETDSSVYEVEGVDHNAHVGVNLASMRLIVGTDNRDIFVDESVIISEYGGIYILQFEDLETVIEAYDYYCLFADFVEADTGISIAEGEAAETVITETVMTVDENPLTELEDAVNGSENSEGMHFDIALIDTGAEGADRSVSMIGDDVDDHNGHGTRMLEYIREQNPDAKVLSIKALGDDGTGTVSSVYAAIEYAISQNVSIINLSVSAMASPDSHIIEEAVTKAMANGITVVGAAGNNGKDASLYVPGGIAYAMIIGAADENGQRRDNSNYGATVDYNVCSETTSEAAARFSGFISLKGLDAVYDQVNEGFIFLCEYNLNWESEEGSSEEDDETEKDSGFQTAGVYSYWNWYTGGTKAKNLPGINEWLNNHPGGKLVDIVNYNRAVVTTHGLKSTIYLANGTPLKYVNYTSGANQEYSDVYWTVSDPVSGYTYLMTLTRIFSGDPYNTEGLSAGSRLAFGVSGKGWFYCEKFFKDAAASSIYSYFTQPKVVNSVIKEGTSSPMITFAWINIKAYRTDAPSDALDLPYLFIGWSDIDAGQFCRNTSESFNNKELYRSSATWEYDYSHGSGYDVYINKNMSSIYADGCFGIQGSMIYQETDQHIYEGAGLNTAWAWTSNAGSNVRLITLAYPVTYKASEGGRITGISSEDVIHGRISSGSEASPDEGYMLTGWKADTDVKLNNGTVIKKGGILDNDQIADAVITSPVNFTAYFKTGAVPIVMPQAGGGGMGLLVTMGLSWMIICGIIYFYVKRLPVRG